MPYYVVIKEIKNANGSWELDHKHTLRAWFPKESAEQELKNQKYNYVYKFFESLGMEIPNLDKYKLYSELFSDKVRFNIVEMIIHC